MKVSPLLATEQYTNALTLPDGTAFEFWQDMVFDLNSHYINYDLNQPMKCEAYINFETQPSGDCYANYVLFNGFNRGISIFPMMVRKLLLTFLFPNQFINFINR